jgi:V8-like Glu-specific endopeptidase
VSPLSCHGIRGAIRPPVLAVLTVFTVLMGLMALTAALGIWTIPHRVAPNEAVAFSGIPTVGALLVEGRTEPVCTASVVWSASGDLLLTAAHCLGHTLRHDLTFAPGYHDGRAPFGTWEVVRQFMPAGWFPRRRADTGVNIDFAFLVVHGDVQRYTGAEIVGSSSPAPARVRVVGYVNHTDRYPITCVRQPQTVTVEGQRQLKFVCGGYAGATSGAPFLVGKRVVGVLGGYEKGGIWRSVSYSSPFGPALHVFYREVTRAL